MIKFKVPATSANLGIGFDCLGMAINLYDYFEIEKSDKWQYEGFLLEGLKSNNLFLKGYKKACLYKKDKIIPLKVKLSANVSLTGGLGSSSCLIVAGIYAYSILNNNCLSKDEMFRLATAIEGHPDNVAPAIFGGLCIVNKSKIHKFNISNKWHFGIFLEDYQISTEEARKVLKKEININDAVNNISSALIAINALNEYKPDDIKYLMNDKIHEPYRKKLIKNYSKYKKIALDHGALAFVISGSGSTCLSISDKSLNINLPNYKEVKIDKLGVRNV